MEISNVLCWMSSFKRAAVLAGSTAIAGWYFSVPGMLSVVGLGLLTYYGVSWIASGQKDLDRVASWLGAPAVMGGYLLYQGAGATALYLPLVVVGLTFFSQYLFELV